MSTRAVWSGLLDDASPVIPARRRGSYDEPVCDLVGGVVVADTDLPGLDQALPLSVPVSVVVSGGAGGVAPAVRWAESLGLRLRRVEVALRDPGDLAGAARRVVTAARACPAPVAVDPGPRQVGSHGWLEALDEVAAGALCLVLDADADPATTSAALDAALDRELTVSLRTARPLRAVTGLLAVRAVLDGGEAATVLSLEDEAVVAALLEDAGPEALTRTRSWCTAVSVPDPAAVAAVLDRLDAW